MKKRWLSILLTAALLLTVAAAGSATAFAAGDIGSQISLISSQMSTLKQNDTAKNWYYAVTDLDHNGRLEFIAAAQHPADRSTNMKVWRSVRTAPPLPRAGWTSSRKRPSPTS